MITWKHSQTLVYVGKQGCEITSVARPTHPVDVLDALQCIDSRVIEVWSSDIHTDKVKYTIKQRSYV